MGEYAFAGLPRMVQTNTERGWGTLSHITGIQGRWDVPVAVFTAPNGFNSMESSDTSGEHAISIALNRATIQGALGNRVASQYASSQDFTLMPAGRRCRFLSAGPVRYAHFYFGEPVLRRWGAELFGTAGNRDDLARDDLVFTIDRDLRGMLDAYLRRGLDGGVTQLEMDSRANLIGLHLLSQHSPLGRPAPSRAGGGLAGWQVRRACEAMDAHLDGGIALAALAAVAGCSATHFSRAFKRSVGLPPFTWLLHRRIERAKDLLANPRLSLAEVALAVGFSAQPAFTTAFRRVAGMTPGAWRRGLR